MKRIILMLLFSISLMVGCTSKIDFTIPQTPPSANYTNDLIISEISTAINTDPNAGGVRNHYVELFNGTTATLDLSQYAIGYQASLDASTLVDWSFPTSATYLQLTGSLDTGKCYVIASPQADKTFVPSNITWGTTSTASADASIPLQLSGNSAIALLKKDPAGTYSLGGQPYKVIDAFGSPNVARVLFAGSSSSRNNFMWTIAGEVNDTRNRTFWRKNTVHVANPNWAVSKGTNATDSEWILSGDRAWDYSNIGKPR
jgi:hypothetical protein